MGGSWRVWRAKNSKFKSLWRGRVSWSVSSRLNWIAPRSTAPYYKDSRLCSLTLFTSCQPWSTTAIVRQRGLQPANISYLEQDIKHYLTILFTLKQQPLSVIQRTVISSTQKQHLNYINFAVIGSTSYNEQAILVGYSIILQEKYHLEQLVIQTSDKICACSADIATPTRALHFK